jgi:ribosomal protein S18 acetylase RimI-like enzyme
MKLASAFKHGLVVQRLIDRLRRVGIFLNPYYLYREGVRQHQTEWPELSTVFPSSVLQATEIASVAASRAWSAVEQIQARIDKGHLCIVLKHRGRIAGFTWADFDEVNDSACTYELAPGEAYLYDAFIAPEFRGRSLAAYMRAESYRLLRAAGRHTFYSISDCFNTPAIKFKTKLNAERIRLYLQIKVRGREVGQWCLRDYERGKLVKSRGKGQ